MFDDDERKITIWFWAGLVTVLLTLYSWGAAAAMAAMP